MFVAVLLLVPVFVAHATEDSLLCAKVKDSYRQMGYNTIFQPVSQVFGAMTYCTFRVKAVEHCVPVRAALEDTNAPDDPSCVGPQQGPVTCYRVRCSLNEAATYLGRSVVTVDRFGARVLEHPRVWKICLPDMGG